MSVQTVGETQGSDDTLSLEGAIQQLINLGEHDPLSIARKIEQRFEEDWLRDELYALRQDFICDLARNRINGRRRSAMTALRAGKPKTELMLTGEWVPGKNPGWKKLSQWTAEDLRAREHYYRKVSGTMVRLADWCSECVALMEAENVKTLGKVKAPLPTLDDVEEDVLVNGKDPVIS